MAFAADVELLKTEGFELMKAEEPLG